MRLQAVVLAVSPFLAVAKHHDSFEHIYGVCNQYKSPVQFTDTGHKAGDKHNCKAPARGHCDAKGAEIPKAETAGDYPQHHMQVRSDDGKIDWKFWKKDSSKTIEYGTDYGTRNDLTKEIKKGEFNVVISPTGGLSLYESTIAGDCPAAQKDCSHVTSTSGSWQRIQAVSAKQTITIKEGVTHSYSNTDSKKWSEEVSASISSGFKPFGIGVSTSVSSTTATEVAQQSTKTFSETKETDVTVGPFPPGTLWQWQWNIKDQCGTSTVKGMDVVRTDGDFAPPCCLPGFAADPSNYRGECRAHPGDPVYTQCFSGHHDSDRGHRVGVLGLLKPKVVTGRRLEVGVFV